MKPLIVIDQDIPFAGEILSGYGTLRAVPGHEIGPRTVLDAQAVVVRSITRVDRALLQGSQVQFVGTATAGVDHMDAVWLEESSVAWASAPGANADSVVEYVLAVMTVIASRRDMTWPALTLGIIGCGQVGQRLADRAMGAGMRVLRNDPPRAQREGEEGFVPLADVLADADVISVHVPLETGGNHPTVGLVDATAIGAMKPGAWLFQTSRGGTVDEAAAVRARRAGHLGALVLDVFEGEPDPSAAAMDASDLATGHIAGYSRDAKRNGVLMIRDALIRHFGISPAGSTHPDQDPVPLRLPSLRAGSIPDPITPAWMEPVIAQVMDIRSDDARFRRLMLGAEDRTLAFHRYRASYPARYGWSRYSATPRSRAEEAMLKALGFGITAKEDAS